MAFALVAGLFGMHVLVGGDHRGHGAAPAMATADVDPAPAHTMAPPGLSSAADAMAVALVGALAAPDVVRQVLTPGSVAGSVLSACLAVLFGALLIASPGCRRRLRPPMSVLYASLRDRDHARPPPRDLLFVLCVLRT